MNSINKFLWWCAGANIDILERCPTDQAKYFGLGGTILFTALMASFAGGYAFFTAFKSVFLSIAFAVFWGMMIFNLDRFIVSSTGKGDGTVKITKDEWISALPRIILAVVIGFIIAMPLELKVFEREINVEIQKVINEERAAMKNGFVDIRNEIERWQKRKSEVNNDLTKIQDALNGGDVLVNLSEEKKNDIESKKQNLASQLNKIKPIYDAGRSRYYRYKTKLEQYDPIYAYQTQEKLDEWEKKKNEGRRNRDKYKSQVENLQKEILNYNRLLNNVGNEIENRTETLKSDLVEAEEKIKVEKANIDTQIATLEELLTNKGKEADDISVQFDGFMAQLIALDRLSYDVDTLYNNYIPNSNNSNEENLGNTNQYTSNSTKAEISTITKTKTPVWYAKWMISILLICIEIAPILFKMMTESGPYDDELDKIKYTSELEKQMHISKLNQEANNSVKISSEKYSDQLEVELQANKELLKVMALAQAEIAENAIKKWKEDEINKLGNGVKHIISTNGHEEGKTPIKPEANG